MKTVQMGPMNTFKQRATHVALGLGLAATLAFGAVMPAMAAPEPVDGTLTISGAADVVFAVPAGLGMGGALGAPITLNGSDQTATGSLVIGVTDYRGTGIGWKVQVSSEGFMLGGVGNALADFAVTDANYTDESTGVSTVPNSIASTAFEVLDTPASFFNAEANSGMGDFDITVDFEVPVPANTLAGAYTADITIDTSNTP